MYAYKVYNGIIHRVSHSCFNERNYLMIDFKLNVFTTRNVPNKRSVSIPI